MTQHERDIQAAVEMAKRYGLTGEQIKAMTFYASIRDWKRYRRVLRSPKA